MPFWLKTLWTKKYFTIQWRIKLIHKSVLHCKKRIENLICIQIYSLKIRKLRRKLSHVTKHDDTVILEGKRLIIDAIKAGFYPNIFVFSRLNLLDGFPFDKSKNLAMYQIPYRNIGLWSELSTSPGFMGQFFLYMIHVDRGQFRIYVKYSDS